MVNSQLWSISYTNIYELRKWRPMEYVKISKKKRSDIYIKTEANLLQQYTFELQVSTQQGLLHESPFLLVRSFLGSPRLLLWCLTRSLRHRWLRWLPLLQWPWRYPPTTLVEITISQEQDFYDVSLVDGYNIAMSITFFKGLGKMKLCWVH